MGTILSVVGGVAILYVYGRRANASDGGHDPTNSSAVNTKCDQSDEVATQGRRNKGSNLSSTSYFHSARSVDASHAIINEVGGDQHINIATNIDPDPDRRDMGDWLSPLNFKMNQIETFQIREAGTGEWLLESREFKDWRDGSSETLWCPGIPGAGKTVLTSIIVNHLRTFFNGCNVAIACIYCNYKEQVDQTPFNLVASLLKQLIQDDSVAYNNVKPLYEYHKQMRTRPMFDEIRTALQSEIERYSKTFVIVDALDESSGVDGTRGKLLTTLRSLGRTVSLLVTSRDIPSIARDFQDSRRFEIFASEQDVRRYIAGRIPHEPRLAKHVEGDQVLQEEIVKQIVESVRGMFLLARLHMDSLATTISRRDLRKGLENLPIEVNAIYDETMKRIEGQIEGDRKLAEQVLSWIIHAYRQLSLNELQHALAVSPGMTEMDPDALVDETILTSVCAGLVVIDNGTSIVHLVHYTAQEYFDCVCEAQFPDAQASITATCLTYLSFDIFGHTCCNSNWDVHLLVRNHVLLHYVALNWGHHARGWVEVIHRDMVLKFLQDSSKVGIAWQILRMYSNPSHSGHTQGLVKTLEMHISSFFGLEQTIRHQLQNGAEPDSTDYYGRTPLSYAVQHGHEAVVKLLLTWDNIEMKFQEGEGGISLSENGEEHVRTALHQKVVDVNACGGEDGNVLQIASAKGHEGIVKLLVEKGADINAQGRYHGSTLQIASSGGHEGIVKLLLQNGADINAQGGHYGNALQAASSAGHEGIVKLLLQNGADINAQGGHYGNALLAASSAGHEGIVKLLLQNGADINAQGEHYGNALQAASSEGHEGIVKLLLQNGADINTQGRYHGSALQIASSGGHEGIVKLLLQNGADINAQGGHYGNALLAASSAGHEGIVKLLLEKGADTNAQGGQWGSALQMASCGGHEGIVKLLLQNGADINAPGYIHRSAIQAASSGGHEGIVKLLLLNGADINAQGGLQAASYGGYEGILKLLLEKGADINAQGGQQGNALQMASCGGRGGIVKLLLQNGADINAQGGHYGNALQAASCAGYEGIVKLLLQNGADINAQGGHYGNALQAASYGGYEGILKLLLEKGADINAQGGQQSNALQAASCGGHEEIVKLLLQNGADINVQGGHYGNALHAASYGGYEGIVKLLLQNGADINAQGHIPGNALQAASSGGHEEIVKLLLQNGADISAQGGHYGNALQAASYGGYEGIVKWLLQNGADINLQGGYYSSPLQAALSGGHEGIVRLLLEKGADIHAQGDGHNNVLQAAIDGGHKQIVSMLLEKGAALPEIGSQNNLGDALDHTVEPIQRMLSIVE